MPVVQAVMCRVLFGKKPENESSEELIKALELVSEKLINQSIGAFFFNGLLNKLPTPGNLQYKNALKTIDSSITKMSADTDNKKNEGLLPLLAEQMSPKQIRDQLFTLFFAGQDTTANAILWTLYHLAKYPDVQNKVRKEVSVLWENPCEASNINAENIEQMQYLNAVIDESMRLYPPVYAAYRDVKEETEIGGYQLKKNTLIILSMYVTHRHPELWVNPDEFDPERFINKKTKGFSFYPYGGGKRICLGMHLAKLEIATILALLVANLKFELEPGFKIKKEIYVVLRPKNGLPLTVSALGK
jgi:cytochrome P450